MLSGFLPAGRHLLVRSHRYPDLVAPCLGLHPLQAAGGQRSVRPQVTTFTSALLTLKIRGAYRCRDASAGGNPDRSACWEL